MHYPAGMRTVTIALATLFVSLAACTSSAADDEGCSDISGNYSWKETVVSSDCPPSSGESKGDNTITIGKSGSGFAIFLTGVSGGCPGNLNLDSCRFQAQCEVTDKNGNTAITYNVDWTFSGKTFSGSLVGALSAGVAGPNACTVTEKNTGARL